MRTQVHKIICIVCPVGCEIEVLTYEGRILSIKGNLCPRGAEYAKREALDPRRVLITVLKVRNGEFPVVPVKTSKPIPKPLIKKAIKVLSKIEVEAPIRRGNIVVENLLGTGVSVIATRSIRRLSS